MQPGQYELDNNVKYIIMLFITKLNLYNVFL